MDDRVARKRAFKAWWESQEMTHGEVASLCSEIAGELMGNTAAVRQLPMVELLHIYELCNSLMLGATIESYFNKPVERIRP